ncbi:MAG TPA: hypothetical protein VEI73_06465 [Candidatus Acidoferrum sp.]|nr:hypothetical protein [Candidatus Acidoferrum sp.]
MDWPDGATQGQPVSPGALPPFPRIWVGYLLGVATFITEIVTAVLHPELLKEPFSIPPIYLFLAQFICLVYWMVFAYEFHLVLKQATSGGYTISPLRAAWFHLIPIFSLYWVFKWPRELARFVNGRLPAPLMHPDRTGLAVFIAFVVFLFLDRGFGMILLFWAASRLSGCLRFALQAPSAPPGLPFS